MPWRIFEVFGNEYGCLANYTFVVRINLICFTLSIGPCRSKFTLYNPRVFIPQYAPTILRCGGARLKCDDGSAHRDSQSAGKVLSFYKGSVPSIVSRWSRWSLICVITDSAIKCCVQVVQAPQCCPLGDFSAGTRVHGHSRELIDRIQAIDDRLKCPRLVIWVRVVGGSKNRVHPCTYLRRKPTDRRRVGACDGRSVVNHGSEPRRRWAHSILIQNAGEAAARALSPRIKRSGAANLRWTRTIK